MWWATGGRLGLLPLHAAGHHGPDSADQSVMDDEAIHLAAAFQLTGFPHVIATLWEIYDPIAVTVADLFYSHLRPHEDSPVLDTTRAAQALHHAVRTVRDQHRNLPSLWAAYVHAGA